MKFTRRAFALAAAATLFAVGGELQAQEVQFSGYTAGCFYSGSTPCTPAGSSTTETYLTYVSSFFNSSTSEGSADLNLGVLSLAPIDGEFSDDTFLLNVLFFSPSVSGAPAIFQAALTGAVQMGAGSVSLFFGPSQTFSFSNGTSSGEFTLDVANVTLDASHNSATLVGHVTTATPEPATVALLATGLVGLVPLYRRRRKKVVA